MRPYRIITTRLGLRNWTDADLEPFAPMCADERVMEFFPKTLNKNESLALINRLKSHYMNHGYCYFAVDRLDTNEFIGFIGLMHQDYTTSFTPFIDIGWRLSAAAWGNGFATEGAKACLDFAFAELNLEAVYAVATKYNVKSQRIMQKIGMEHFESFNHPKLTNNKSLQKCVAYRVLKK